MWLYINELIGCLPHHSWKGVLRSSVGSWFMDVWHHFPPKQKISSCVLLQLFISLKLLSRFSAIITLARGNEKVMSIVSGCRCMPHCTAITQRLRTTRTFSPVHFKKKHQSHLRQTSRNSKASHLLQCLQDWLPVGFLIVRDNWFGLLSHISLNATLLPPLQGARSCQDQNKLS